ncbi:hypothetical protein ACP70R_017853 [Stipagrostis hirtigluma subsp. patula]
MHLSAVPSKEALDGSRHTTAPGQVELGTHGSRRVPSPSSVAATVAELPGDTLSEIAGRLHDAADFVGFHAVCRPWREAPPPPVRPASTRASYDRCGRVLALACSDDGDRTAVVINPLTGDATSLPPLPQHICSSGNAWRSAQGIACANGAVVLHTLFGPRFAAILLRPGETDWEDVDITGTTEPGHEYGFATLCWSGVLHGSMRTMAEELPRRNSGRDRYVLESHGELLCIDIQDTQRCLQGQPGGTPALAVSAHMLEVRDDGRPHWVKRDHGRGIDHMCLFLDWFSGSGFAIDARELTGGEATGGCAYVVDEEWNVVYRYSFKDGATSVMDELPGLPAPFDRVSMWYMPRPRIPQLRSRRE